MKKVLNARPLSKYCRLGIFVSVFLLFLIPSSYSNPTGKGNNSKSPSLSIDNTPILEIDTKGHKGKICDLIFTQDGQHLVSASQDKTVRVWNIKTGQLIRTLRGHSGHGLDGKISRK